MKIRVIGTGFPHVRHPIIPCTYLIQLAGMNMVIGCPPQIGSKLESINMKIEDIDLWVIGDTRVAYSGGLEELSYTLSRGTLKHTVASTAAIMSKLKAKYQDGVRGRSFDCFDARQVLSVKVADDHFGETVQFMQNSPGSTAFFFKEAKIALCNIDKLGVFSDIAQLILCDIDGEPDIAGEIFREYPVYVQQKVWVVGYRNDYQQMEELFPILPLTQGTCIFDSERKDKYLNKETFIRNDTKRTAGNLNTTS